MDKYYYDDPLKAAWMLREHGIEFVDTNARSMAECMPIHLGTCGAYWVHPDSYDKFRPQLFDIVKVDDAYFHVVSGDAIINGCVFLARKPKGKPQCYNEWAAGQIIMRHNNIPFFMPELEEPNNGNVSK